MSAMEKRKLSKISPQYSNIERMAQGGQSLSLHEETPAEDEEKWAPMGGVSP